MNFKLLGAAVILLVMVESQSAHAQVGRQPKSVTYTTTFELGGEVGPMTYGIFGDAGLNIHRANFQTLPGVPNCCPLFETGSGLGSAFGGLLERSLTPNSALGARLSYVHYGGELKANQTELISINSVGVVGIIQHTISTNFATVSIEPYYRLGLLGSLSLQAGLSAGLVVSDNYQQREVLTEPTDRGTFTNGLRTRNELSGAMPNGSKFRLGAIAGLSYDLPMNHDRSLMASPEVMFDYGLTPIVKGLAWNVSLARGGVSIRYTPQLHPDTTEPPQFVQEERVQPTPSAIPPALPTPSPKPPMLNATISAVGMERDGTESSGVEIRVEEFYSTHLVPLLPFVCFDRNGSSIPSRYHTLSQGESGSFELRSADTTTNITVYHDILNIIGSRLRAHPAAQLTVTGCVAGDEAADLAKPRSEAVAEYLTDVWNIPSKRIHLASRGLPKQASPESSQDGIDENRRVELSSNDASILAPVTMSDTVRTATPPAIRFNPNVVAEAGIRSWKLDVHQDAVLLHQDSGSNRPASIVWDMASDPQHVPKAAVPITFAMALTDSSNQSYRVADQIPVKQTTLLKKRLERVNDKSIERYTLILFNFGSTEIDAANRQRIDLINREITSGTEVEVVGHTDRTGEDTTNLRISELRAKATAAALHQPSASVKGLGKSSLMYDNSIPEGRFYSRTVDVTLIKPLDASGK